MIISRNEKLFKDLVAVAVEKTLSNIGTQAYQITCDILEAHDMTFRDCYSRPDVLNFALKNLYGNSYMVLVNEIRKKMEDFQDKKKVLQFIEIIS